MPSLDVAINSLKAEAGAKKFDKSVKKIQRGAAGVDKSVKKTDKNLNKMGGSLSKVAIGMVSMAAAYKGMRFAQSAIKEFAAFEQQLANVSTMLDEQTMVFLPQYKKQLAGLAIEFGQTTDTLSKGLYDILSASVGAADAVDVLRVASKAAIGGLTTTATAADAITTVMNSYGMEAKDAAKISDILFATVKGGKITFGELAGSIGKVVSIAASAGLEFEQVSAAIATMTRNGIKSDMAMTSLKAIITAFISPTDEAKLMAKEFGLVLNANTLETLGLTGAMELLTTATAEETAAIFPNIRALLGVEATRKQVVAMIEDHTKALNSDGMAQEAYTKNANTMTMALAKNREMWNGIKRDIAEGIQPAVRSWLAGMSLLVDDTDKLLDKLAERFADPDLTIADGNVVTRFNEARMNEADALVNAAKEFARIQKEMQDEAAIENFVGPPAPIKAKVSTLSKEEADKEMKLAAEKAEAFRRMYDDMDSRGEASYQNRILLLNQEFDAYTQFINDEALLDQWYREQKAGLDAELKLTGEDFQAGFSTNIGVMQKDMMTLGEIGAQTAETMKTSMAGAMKNMIMNGATLKEAMHGFAMSMLSSFIDVITQMIAMQIMASAFGVGAPAGGGGFMGPPAPSAKGNVFTAGVKAFRNGGLIGQPTVFPMANGGIGLAGEAGTEAIMPLGRDGQGRLGVRNSDGEGKTPVKIVNVVDESMMEEYLNSGAGERVVMNIMSRNRESGSDAFV